MEKASLSGEEIKERLVLNVPLNRLKRAKPFEFDYDGSNLNEAITRIDAVLSDTMQRMKDSFPSCYVYGLGLSGGLDSRIVLHYASKAGITPKCFIYGDAFPHIVLASRDYKNAIEIGKKYGIKKRDIKILDTNTNYEQNFIYDCDMYPDDNINARIIAGIRRFPRSNILLTGMLGGESMGSCIPANKPESITDYVFKRLSNLTPINNGRTYTELEGILSKEEYNEMHSKLDDYFSKFDNDYVTALYSYLYSHVVVDRFDRAGVTQSRFKYVDPHFSIFNTPEYIKEMKHWNPEWLSKHIMQREFHKHVVPDLCFITNQRWMVPFNYQDTIMEFVMKYYCMGMFALRWHGLQYHKWLYELLKSDFARNIFENKNERFDSMFSSNAVLNLPKELSILGCNILKLKYVMDYNSNY